MNKILLTFVAILTILSSTSLASKIPTDFQWGVTFGFHAKNGFYSSAEAKKQVDKMVEVGATWVTLIATVWQDSCHSTFQYRDFIYTPNDIELMDIIDYIHSKGMKVQLRPMLECKDGYGRLGVIFPKRGGNRIPGRYSNARELWFQSMKERSEHYGRIAERTKCEVFCLDSELDTMTEENELWLEVVKAVRKVYTGSLTSCHTLHTGKIDFVKSLSNPEHWFHSLDFLSISYYCPARTKADVGKEMSVEDMMKRLKVAHTKMKAIADAAKKPILFGECGCSSNVDSALSPSAMSPFIEFDEEEQARYMEALFRVFAHEKWCMGFQWWKWDQHVAPKPGATVETTRACDFTFAGKKAEKVFKKWASKKDR
jgi:hypothetical protein